MDPNRLVIDLNRLVIDLNRLPSVESSILNPGYLDLHDIMTALHSDPTL